MQKSFDFSWATHADYGAVADVMFDAVRNGPSKYTDAQREQWVPARRSGADWNDRLARHKIIVARHETRVVGFMSLDEGGYIDFAYIRPEMQGSGLFRELYSFIAERSRARGDARLWVHASLMAQPAFSALGFTIVEHQCVSIGSETFERYEMELQSNHSYGGPHIEV